MSSVSRKQILGDWKRKILVGERLKGYTALRYHVRKMGLNAIIKGCETDLAILKERNLTDQIKLTLQIGIVLSDYLSVNLFNDLAL